MAKPQQPELHRSGLTPADPASAKTRAAGPRQGGQEATGPVPEDNLPGHHPAHEQDKPVEAFVARAQERTRQARAATDATEKEAAIDAGSQAGPDRPTVSDAERAQAVANAGSQWERKRPASGERQPRPPEDRRIGAVAPALDAANHDATPETRPGPRGGMPDLPLEVVIPGLALLDAARRPQTSWDEIGESRTVWMTRIVLFAWLGAWRYTADVKPRLEAAGRARDLAGG